MNGWGGTVGTLPRRRAAVPGRAQDGPEAQNSPIRGTLEVLHLFSTEAQRFKQYFSQTFCLLFVLLLSLFITHL